MRCVFIIPITYMLARFHDWIPDRDVELVPLEKSDVLAGYVDGGEGGVKREDSC